MSPGLWGGALWLEGQVTDCGDVDLLAPPSAHGMKELQAVRGMVCSIDLILVIVPKDIIITPSLRREPVNG